MLETLISWIKIKLLWSISTASLLNTCLAIVLANVLRQILQKNRNEYSLIRS